MAVLNIFNQVKIGAAVLRLIQDPTQTMMVFRVAEVALQMKDRKALHSAVDFALEDPGFQSLVERRFLPAEPDLEALGKLPEGTLGQAFAKHMLDNNLKLNFYPDVDPNNTFNYFEKRARQVHDLWHVVCGYGIDVKGELELQGFTLANLRVGISATIIAAGIFHILKNRPAEVYDYFNAVVQGFVRGQKANYLLGIPLEEMWEKPLAEVRQIAGILDL